MNSMQVVFDCADPEKLAKFWQSALDYKPEDPPRGFATWDEFLAKNNLTDDNSMNSAVDPEGVSPRLLFQRVPEGKQVKNRLHLDLFVSDGHGTPPEKRREQTAAKVEQLLAAGATKLYEFEEHGSFWVTMADPEGNEFCII